VKVNWASWIGAMRMPRHSGTVLHGVTAATAIFGLALSVDYGRAAAVKADLQAATDAAAYAAATAICSSDEERTVLAHGVFNASYRWDASRPPVIVPRVIISEDEVSVIATEPTDTSMGRAAGVEWMEVSAVSNAMSWRGARSCLAPAREYLDALLALADSRAKASRMDPERPARWSRAAMRR
jgi:hypothetical protein